MNPILDSIQFAVRECASKTTDYSILDRWTIIEERKEVVL